LKIVNLWSGPGSGKSTTASDLFAHMKWLNINVELVNEYAKEVTWDERFKILEDQLYIMAKQNHKLWRLKGQVDCVITDSPLAMSLVYAQPDYLPGYFKKLGLELFNHYDNINIFLKREKPYHKVGRSQTEDQARQLDSKIKDLMLEFEIPFIEVPANQDAKYVIFDIIKEQL